MRHKVFLNEWSTVRISDIFNPGQDNETIEKLSKKNILKISEYGDRTEIQSFSYVGQITLGNLDLIIAPKIKNLPLYTLLNYAYDLRDEQLLPDSNFSSKNYGFFELLFLKLAKEVNKLIHIGLIKNYVLINQELSYVRGRIDFKRLIQMNLKHSAQIPCSYYNRDENTLFNQILLSGCRLAKLYSNNRNVKSILERNISFLEINISSVKLNNTMISEAFSQINRLNKNYSTVLRIIHMIYNSYGLVLDEEDEIPINGFLFDMNKFFQHIVTKYLTETLRNYKVIPEYILPDFIEYELLYNHPLQKKKYPRPDIALSKDNKHVLFIDAKYIDLWNHNIPAYIIYQMAMYSLASDNQTALVLFPAVTNAAKDIILNVQNPNTLTKKLRIIFRPFNLTIFSKVIEEKDGKKAHLLAMELISV